MTADKFEAKAIIINMLRCKQCKGKGIIWNPHGRDKKCQCRKFAEAWVREQE